jgi:CO/xanthine dehydrogenase FAD-binding subunit
MITEYHRPATLDEATSLLGTSGAYVIVEGTAPSSTAPPHATIAIDLQSLNLDDIEVTGGRLLIGSMTTLSDLSSSPLAPPMIAELASREHPSTIRNAATIGGVIATNDPESELLAGLVAFDASVTIAREAAIHDHPVESTLDNPQLIADSIIIDVSIEVRGTAVAHRTGRTPMDRPIVMVVGHKAPDGDIRLAATGVDTHVIAMSPEETETLDPPSDFRGTSQYRKALATVLTKRVVSDLSGGGQR